MTASKIHGLVFRVSLLVFVLQGDAVVVGAPSRDHDLKATLDAVTAAWRAREARIQCAEYAWQEVVVTVAPIMFDAAASSPASAEEKPRRVEKRCELLIKGEKFFYSTFGPGVGTTPEGKPETFEVRSTDAFDGALTRSHNEFIGRTGRFPLQGRIAAGRPEWLLSSVHLDPLLLHYQPFQQKPNWLSSFASVKRGVIEEKPCLVLESRAEASNQRVDTIWVDPDQGYAIRRMSKRGDFGEMRVDLWHTLDAVKGPVLMRWKEVTTLPGGEFRSSKEAIVQTAKVNHNLADSRFTFEFPVGTRVIDTSGGAKAETKYIVRADGSKRMILPGEGARAKSAEELMSTESGELLEDRPGHSRWLAAAVSCAAMTLVAIFLWRVYGRRRA